MRRAASQWGVAMQDFRRMARHCLVEAQRSDITDERRTLLVWMANEWIQLAKAATSLGAEKGAEPGNH
jgi:hypothetical protein